MAISFDLRLGTMGTSRHVVGAEVDVGETPPRTVEAALRIQFAGNDSLMRCCSL